MLEITVPEGEFFIEKTNEFINVNETTLKLEHSLVSISKWEQKWCIPFLDKSKVKTREQTIDYIKHMTLTQNVNPLVYEHLDAESIRKINEYIEAPMTATWFNDSDKKDGSKEIITSELIYYWMIALNIPVEFQKWHLNRLLTLIRICNIKNSPNKKMSTGDVMKRNRELNNLRKAKLHTNG